MEDGRRQMATAKKRKAKMIDSGHFDNLKYDDGKARVWITRQTVADYYGDRKAWMQARMTIEQLVGGSWKQVWPEDD
jgi:hypothetical protein